MAKIAFVLEDRDGEVEVAVFGHSEQSWMELAERFRRFLLSVGYLLPDGEFDIVDYDKDVLVDAAEYQDLLAIYQSED